MKFRRSLLCIGLLFIAVPAWAYEEIKVTDGGTITGTVRLTGGKPTPKAFNLITFPDPVYCGRISTGTGWRLLDEFTIGPSGGFKDVVVWLEDVAKGRPFTFTPPKIEARDCEFTPFVNAVRDEDQVVIINMDPVMHDIQAYETSQLGPRVLFNSPLPMNPHHKRQVTAHSHEHLAGEPMKQTINLTKGRRIFVMQCGFHAYMISWGMAMEHPYYAVTGADGAFTIGEVPPGEYRLMAWHPETGPVQEQRITVPAKGSISTSFQFKAPTGRRSVHEMVDNPHYGIEALGKPLEILPTLRRQTP